MLEDAKLLDDDYDGGSGNRSWGTSLKVDGVSYATSLFWQPLQNSGDYMTEVEEASNSILEGADLFCIKGGKAPQFGICVSHEGFKSGENVAAVSLITALSNISSFVAVFKVNGGWWYTCIRNDIILSDGDMLFLSEEEAKNQFMSMMAVPNWGKKIAPAEWGIEDTEDLDLGEILQRGAKVKLQKIKELRGSKLIMVVAISAVVGIWLVSSLIDKLFLTPAKRPVVVPVRPKVIQQVEVKEVPKPWEKITNPQQFMENCYEGITSLANIMPPGWGIGVVSCSNNSVVTSWRREIGLMSWADMALKNSGLQFAGYSFDASGSVLSASLPLKTLELLTSPPEKIMTDLRNELNNKFQSLGLQVSLSEEEVSVGGTSPAPRGKGPGAARAVAPTKFRALKFSFDSTYNPLTWAGLLTKYSGLELRIITYSPNSDVWHYEGAIYVL